MTTKGGKGGLKVTGPETRRYHNLMGTHLIYLGNVLAGVLNVTFAEAPWPTWMWIWLRGPKGEYLEDERSGQGCMIWTDGSQYEGEWDKGI